jgi:hypothetical protein
MTICIGIKVAEGLVLAADSLSTLTNQEGGIVQQFQHSQKLSQIGRYDVGTLTWGAGSIASLTIDSLIAEFAETLAPSGEVEVREGYTVHDIAGRLFEFVNERYKAHYESQKRDPEPLGIAIGGYSTGAHFADLYGFFLPFDTEPVNYLPDLADGLPNFNVRWFGQTEPLVRLMKGADTELLKEALQGQYAEQDALIDAALNLYGKFEYPVLFNLMPLQDAIDFAVYLVSVVIGKFRFTMGLPLCGGDIDVAIVSRGGFEWLKRKTWLVT